ncbi:glycosyltransferase [Clostridium sp.]|uniref:glycosyltransferase n=1 Tax=Clostridium sp. TaxID=1506 RepID=UPI0034648937
MNNKTIKYVGFYDSFANSTENRNSCLSATNKMNYIIKSLNKNGYDVEIISPSWTINNKFYKGKTVQVMPKVRLKLFPTLPWKCKLFKVVSVIFSFLCMFFYLIFNSAKNEQIIVYHSKWLSLPLLLLKKIKNELTIILEVEEIYDDVKHSKFWRGIEYKFFEVADKYIFPTELLNKKLNIENKPYTIIYGTYQVEEEQKLKFEDGKIHVVYAGTFDPRKGGAIAVAAAEYLPKNYHVHIIGFGSSEDTKLLLDKIEQVSKVSYATLTYDGLLKGKEYIEFLQKCDIGLSTQIPDATYNETSFPSKILSYMANGLRVVSVRIKAIEISSIGNIVYYYDEQSPKAIADAIMKINIYDSYDSVELIKKLDKDFTSNIKKLLEC